MSARAGGTSPMRSSVPVASGSGGSAGSGASAASTAAGADPSQHFSSALAAASRGQTDAGAHGNGDGQAAPAGTVGSTSRSKAAGAREGQAADVQRHAQGPGAVDGHPGVAHRAGGRGRSSGGGGAGSAAVKSTSAAGPRRQDTRTQAADTQAADTQVVAARAAQSGTAAGAPDVDADDESQPGAGAGAGAGAASGDDALARTAGGAAAHGTSGKSGNKGKIQQVQADGGPDLTAGQLAALAVWLGAAPAGSDTSGGAAAPADGDSADTDADAAVAGVSGGSSGTAGATGALGAADAATAGGAGALAGSVAGAAASAGAAAASATAGGNGAASTAAAQAAASAPLGPGGAVTLAGAIGAQGQSQAQDPSQAQAPQSSPVTVVAGGSTAASALPQLLQHLAGAAALTGAALTGVAGPDPRALTVAVPVSDPSWPQALAAQVHWLASSQIQSATLKLSPEHLGPLEVRIDLQQSQVNVSFNATHADTRNVLAEAMPRLRAMFAAGGLTLGQATVQQEPRSGAQSQPQARDGAPSAAVKTVEPVAIGALRALGLVDEYV